MRNLLILAIAACIGGMFSTAASARPVTTDACLARGLCAYVSPTRDMRKMPWPGKVSLVRHAQPGFEAP